MAVDDDSKPRIPVGVAADGGMAEDLAAGKEEVMVEDSVAEEEMVEDSEEGMGQPKYL